MLCFRMSQYMLESMFPSINRSSPVPAALMQPQTMMLPPPCLTVGKAQFSWYSSPGHRYTCWTPSLSESHQTTGHGSSNSCSWTGCLQQTVFRLSCEPASEEGQLSSGTTAMQTDLSDGPSTDKLTFHFCNL